MLLLRLFRARAFGPFNDDATFGQLAGALCSTTDLDGYGDGAGLPVTLAGQVKPYEATLCPRLTDRAGFLEGDGIPPTPDLPQKAKDALA